WRAPQRPPPCVPTPAASLVVALWMAVAVSQGCAHPTPPATPAAAASSSPGGPRAPRRAPAPDLVQAPTALPPWSRVDVARPDAPTVTAYVAHDNHPKPLLVLLQGSNCIPLFATRRRADGSEGRVSSNLWGGVEDALLPKVHLVLVERVGVESFGPPIPPEAWPPARVTDACAERTYDKALRVRDVADVIEALANRPWTTGVWIAGHSEGA